MRRFPLEKCDGLRYNHLISQKGPMLMNDDIFLLYRPQDAQPHAWMLHRDLTAAGYRVYFPSECPQAEPSEALKTCRAVLLLLSPAAFGPAVWDPEDPLRNTVLHALALGKSMTGIILTGFEGFPAGLPVELEPLRQLPCLSMAGTGYPDALRTLMTDLLPGMLREPPKILLPQQRAPDPDLNAALAAFAKTPETDQTIVLQSCRQEQRKLTLHRMEEDSEDEMLAFQNAVVSAMPGGREKNLFESLSRAEFTWNLRNDLCIGVYEGRALAALLVLLPHPTAEQNLLLDLEAYRHIDPAEVLVVDAVLVSDRCRGFGLQQLFNRLADLVSRERGIRYECTVVSPLNFYSLRNTILSGFRLVGNFRKYHSTRNFFVKEL